MTCEQLEFRVSESAQICFWFGCLCMHRRSVDSDWICDLLVGYFAFFRSDFNHPYIQVTMSSPVSSCQVFTLRGGLPGVRENVNDGCSRLQFLSENGVPPKIGNKKDDFLSYISYLYIYIHYTYYIHIWYEQLWTIKNKTMIIWSPHPAIQNCVAVQLQVKLHGAAATHLPSDRNTWNWIDEMWLLLGKDSRLSQFSLMKSDFFPAVWCCL